MILTSSAIESGLTRAETVARTIARCDEGLSGSMESPGQAWSSPAMTDRVNLIGIRSSLFPISIVAAHMDPPAEAPCDP